MTLREIATLAAVVVVASGCAASGGASSSTSHPVPRVTTASYGPTHTAAGGSAHSAWEQAFLRVKPNMPIAQVEALLGRPPFRVHPGPRETCWLYGRRRTDLTGGAVCFNAGRVTFVATPELAQTLFSTRTADGA